MRWVSEGRGTLCPWLVAVAVVLVSLTGVAEHSIHTIGFHPASPANLQFDQRVNVSFIYTTTAQNGVEILVYPMVGGRHARGAFYSGLRYDYAPTGSGGSGFFTIRQAPGTLTVDRVLLRMMENGNVLYETHVNVNYTFGVARPHTVSTPNRPAGPSTGNVGQILTFTAGGAACSHPHSVQYRFHWGGNDYSSWSTATSRSTSWPSAGTYQVRVQARCAVDDSVVSSWSTAWSVTIDPIAQPLRGYEVLDQTFTVPAGAVRGAQVTAPGNKVVLSGGAEVVGAGSSDSDMLIILSLPITVGGVEGRGWRVEVRNGSNTTRTVRMFAVCVERPSGYEVVRGSFPVRAGQFAKGIIAVPEGKVPFGAGFSGLGFELQESIRMGPTGWMLSVASTRPDVETAVFYVTCAHEPAGYGSRIVDAAVPANGELARVIAAPAGTRLVGGGAVVLEEVPGSITNYNWPTRIQASAHQLAWSGQHWFDRWWISIRSFWSTSLAIRFSAVYAEVED